MGNELEVYKIYDPETQLYATASGWSKKGKTWTTTTAIKLHLRQILEKLIPQNYLNDQGKVTRIERNRQYSGWQYQNCILRKLSEKGVEDSAVVDLLKVMPNLRDKSGVSTYDKMVELYGEDYL